MNRKVLIAGAGQLGSRYLQGLSMFAEPLDIWVFDPAAESLTRAERRWKEMEPASGHEVRYVSALSLLPKNMDLAVVSTTADVRTAVVGEIIKHSEVAYWVLEKVLAQSASEITELQRMLGNGKLAWVNTPRHMWPLYRKLRDLYKNKGEVRIDARVEGFQGLACNAIHYIDFVSRWNDAPPTAIDISGLKPMWYASKRDRFYEVDGELLVHFADGSRLKLSCDHHKLCYKVRLKIGQNDEWEVNEAEGIGRTSAGRVIEGAMEPQSRLTAPLVRAILAEEACGLPTLAQSAQQHTLLLNSLLDHWNCNMPNKLDRLPIT